MMQRVINGNVLSFCKHYRGDPFHSILCDPPYHLTSIVKRFANGEPEHTKTAHDIANRSTPHARQAAGFMGAKWDGGDVAFQPSTWKALARLLYPGAFIFAFAGTRGYHRMAVAMEDAGLIIHPAIGWIFGSGFPKATRIDTQIDNAAGVEREIISTQYRSNGRQFAEGQSGFAKGEVDITKPATPAPQEWSGHRYGLQALKPAFEFIAVAQVPYRGKPINCITRTGSGAMNIEGARIGIDSISSNRWTDDAHPFGGGAGNEYETVESIGRWPANFALCHSPECNGECSEGCPIKMLDEQSGELTSGKVRDGYLRNVDSPFAVGNGMQLTGIGDSGGASRFFFNADYMHERLEDSDPVMYQAKAGRSERDAGLIDFQLTNDGSTIGTGIGLKDQSDVTPRNVHPTVKPISLCKWLATLLLPPDSYKPRRLLVPFSGAGSEMIGATLAGWDQIVGVEMESEYATIAKSRLVWWEQKLADGHTDLDRMLKQWNRESEEDESDNHQMSIFD